MFRSIRSMFSDPAGKVLAVAAVSTIVAGTAAYMFLEGWSVVDALYFSVITLTTIGFGDLHPTTDVSKLFTIAYILTGLGIVALFLSELPKHTRTAERALHARGAEPASPDSTTPDVTQD